MSVEYVDPINGKSIRVQSVCFPSKSLLQGKDYARNNDHLEPNVKFLRLTTKPIHTVKREKTNGQ